MKQEGPRLVCLSVYPMMYTLLTLQGYAAEAEGGRLYPEP
jgi:hypothetical protein